MPLPGCHQNVETTTSAIDAKCPAIDFAQSISHLPAFEILTVDVDIYILEWENL
jgi:hypothetical protein